MRQTNKKSIKGRHNFEERFARDQMISLLNIGIPYPVRDAEVDFKSTVAKGKKGDVKIKETQPSVYYQLRDRKGDRILNANNSPLLSLKDEEGNWEQVTLKTPIINKDIAFRIQAARSWTQNKLNDIFMISDHKGWIVGNGIILHTDSGGAYWNIQASALWVRQNLKAVYFLDEKTGWVAGGKLILHTVDGGDTWTEQLHAVGAEIHSLYFSAEDQGMAFGSKSWYRWQLSTGGEEKWVLQSPFWEGRLFATSFQGAAGVAIAEKGQLFTTKDNGATWTQSKSPAIPNKKKLTTVFTLPSQEAWVAGANGTLLYSKKIGGAWKRIVTGIIENLNAVAFYNTNEGWICGNSGALVYTIDAGANWLPQKKYSIQENENQPELEALCLIQKGKKLLTFAIGARGTILQQESKPLKAATAVWAPNQLSVLLHKTVNIRLGIMAALPVSFNKLISHLHEFIVPYGNTTTQIYINDSQEGLSYRLLKAGTSTAIFSEIKEGDQSQIALPVLPSKALVEDIDFKIKAFRTATPSDSLFLNLFPDKSMQVFVQPNTKLNIQLVSQQVKYGEKAKLSIAKTQKSVQYQVYAYVPSSGSYLPDNLQKPDNRHPKLARSHYDKALLLEELDRLSQAKKYLLKAIEVQALLYPPGHPDMQLYLEKMVDLDEKIVLKSNTQAIIKKIKSQGELDEYLLRWLYRLEKNKLVKSYFDAYVALYEGRTSDSLDLLKVAQEVENETPMPGQFIPVGKLESGNGETIEIAIEQETGKGWKEDAMLLVLATKKEGKGGSVWLNQSLMLRVLPKVEGIEVRQEPAEDPGDGSPIYLVLKGTQSDVGYHLIPPRKAKHDSKEVLTATSHQHTGIGWEGSGHGFGMRVGVDWMIGTEREDWPNDNLPKTDAQPPFKTQADLFPSGKLRILMKRKHLEADNLEIKAIKSYSGLEEDMDVV